VVAIAVVVVVVVVVVRGLPKGVILPAEKDSERGLLMATSVEFY
jgi:hypothetical protein